MGFGYDSHFDNWQVGVEWTRLHQAHAENFHSGADDGKVFILAAYPYNSVGDKIHGKWRLDMDLLDFSLLRSFYVGKRIIFQPFLGIRAAWFKQRLTIDMESTPGTPWAQNTLLAPSLDAKVQSKNWGLGVRAGMDSQYLMGAGFRIDGKASFSLLFTRFTHLKYFGGATTITTSGITHPVLATDVDMDLDVVRPQAELGLGFGWGSYFCNRRCHFDLDLTYDFNMFWDQNMLRSLPDSLVLQSGIVPTDLFYHGPTFSVRLDF